MMNVAPTLEFLLAVLWLGTDTIMNGSMRTVPMGSGVVVHHQNEEYLATALHVAEACNYQPLVRRNSGWIQARWEMVGRDEDADVAVLRTPNMKLSNLTPRYGLANALIGAMGRAMGFPVLSDPEEISHITETEGYPIPLTVLISSYLRFPTDVDTGIHYTGGYVNAGFSGGAMLLPTSSGWSIGGIITHKEGVRRNVQRRDATSNLFVEDDELAFTEPSGIIRFAGIGVATGIIDRTVAAR